MTPLLRGMSVVALTMSIACGSSSSSASTTGTANAGGSSSSSQPVENDQMVQEGMVVANALRDEYVQLKSDHEAAWQQRIEIATGPDLNTIGPRYASVSADFNARAEQAWQAMNAAVGQLHQHHIDQFRQLINQSRSHVAVMRQMVESIQGELMQMQSAAPQPAPAEGSETETDATDAAATTPAAE